MAQQNRKYTSVLDSYILLQFSLHRVPSLYLNPWPRFYMTTSQGWFWVKYGRRIADTIDGHSHKFRSNYSGKVSEVMRRKYNVTYFGRKTAHKNVENAAVLYQRVVPICSRVTDISTAKIISSTRGRVVFIRVHNRSCTLFGNLRNRPKSQTRIEALHLIHSLQRMFHIKTLCIHVDFLLFCAVLCVDLV